MAQMIRMVALLSLAAVVAVAQQGNMQLDQRNMVYKSGPKPLLDFETLLAGRVRSSGLSQ
jgi:hypothetical protein